MTTPTQLKVDSPLSPLPESEPKAPGGNGAAPFRNSQPQAEAPQPQAQTKAPELEAAPEVAPQEDPANQPNRWINGKCRIPLRKKVQAHGEMIDFIELREPTPLDIENIGQPVTLNVFDNNPRPLTEAPIMTAMISQLAAIPLSSVRKMDTRDWQNASLALFRFFVPDRWTALS